MDSTSEIEKNIESLDDFRLLSMIDTIANQLLPLDDWKPTFIVKDFPMSVKQLLEVFYILETEADRRGLSAKLESEFCDKLRLLSSPTSTMQ